ncbi:Ca2+-binding EF-hand superfamily protein [Allocatelliglobosispora scoriae]|uniref:Ca2+-binding EF-hand superfamily protein n=1 Tax=Allocatelliglobosispora scoriae TaxID=643052 RepID=A0A841BKP8_9ACTN|nr:EF-hand domain-containing protein [Allocatelliglobosispora scoriae]MBB5867769.1 Ca2+-binding EF-hand superfamily protein [Allocatelliglobosispora scoriae]
MTASDNRLRTRFSMMDGDGDGVLSGDDFTGLATQIVRTLGVAPASPKALALTRAAVIWWDGLRTAADADNDGVVSLAEYARVVHTRAWFDAHVRPWADALVDLCDLDDDGRLVRSELTAMLLGTGWPIASVVAALDGLFGQADSIPREAWTEFVAEFYTTDDPHTRTNAMLTGAETGGEHR